MTEPTTDNERVARRVAEEIATEGKFGLVEEVFAEDVVEHGAFGRVLRGREAVEDDLRRFKEAFPDLSVTVEDAVTEGDTVAFRATVRGTHEGPFMGAEPTHEVIEVQNTVFTRVEDGKVAERWVQPDTLGLLRQLGLVSLPNGATGR